MRQIMIVDDESGIRTLIGIMLQRAGFNVVKAGDAEHALSLLEDETPHLFILDIMMPGVDGIELCRILRSRPDTAKTPIVMLSARYEPEIVAEARGAGADDFVHKPVLSSLLLQKVSQFVPQVS